MKNIYRVLSGLVLSFSLGAALPAGFGQTSGEVPLQGTWEGEVAGPRRPYRLQLEVRPDDSQNPVKVTLDGRFALPVSDVGLAGQRLQFLSNLNGQDVHFEVSAKGEDLAGSVLAGDTRLTLELWRSRVYPEPDSREEAWLQDLDSLERRFIRFDRSFTASGKAQFRRLLAQLGSELPSLGDSQVVVRLSEMLALAGNAHTRLYLLRNRTELRRLPLRLSWFQEGAFVVRATAAHESLLGCRVTAIEGHALQEVFDRVIRLFAGNRSWQLYKSPYFMTSPEILAGIGMAGNPEVIRYGLECNGRRRVAALSALPLERKREPTEAWKDLTAHSFKGWVSLLGTALPPLYLKEPSRHYWMSYLPDADLLYFQYNRAQDMSEGESLEEFAVRLKGRIESERPRTLVVDLRFNTGGNSGVARALMEELAGFNREDAERRLFVIVGRATFSAGISHVGQFVTRPGAVLVGEGVGDVLDTWSEGGNLVLPNSGLTAHYTNGFHAYSKRDYPEFKPYYQDLDLEPWQVNPHVWIEPTFSAYREGRDLVMEAILGNR